ncbi:unnamed protein product [Lupinus luteus]|uniref:Uncharacterized protein n=1 Tax=Lupinus luteus TaxID=3873 RepID=A0AAV1XHK4_LUPLU
MILEIFKISVQSIESLIIILSYLEGKYEALEKYGNDLTELARRDKLDPVIGRDDEIRRCIQILARRTKNNPMNGCHNAVKN